MLRILLCMTCCSAPKSSRPARGKANVVENNAKLVEEANTDNLIATNEKNQLLSNQIQANIESYGSKDGDVQGKILLSASSKLANVAASATATAEVDESDKLEVLDEGIENLTTVSTSARPQFSQRKVDESELVDYTGAKELNFDDDDDDNKSASPPSSIDIESFKENPSDNQPPPPSSPQSAYSANANADYEQPKTTTIGSQQVIDLAQIDDQLIESTPETSQARLAINIPSTTKIGDYARIEYSPVEDLESLTTMSYSYSRGGSEKGGKPMSVTESDKGLSRKSSPSRSVTTNGGLSRRSSQGIESTSISIASQLSNEQLQQNLTNMIETANSPTQLFGTIGLPLGPPLDNLVTETAKTSPETTGAALTSASQDSLSDASLDSAPARSRPAATRAIVTSGGALVNDSIEDSIEMVPAQTSPIAVQQGSSSVGKSPIASLATTERLESPTSMVTTTSGGLTNPTPTPSEMSATSSTKKKRKLRAKALFNKLRPGSKKKAKDEKIDNDNK